MTTTLPTAADRLPVPPRVPGSMPIIGHLFPLLNQRLEFLRKARSYGPVVTVRLGRETAYLINDHELLRRVLIADAASFKRGIHFQKARSVAGDGIITASGAFHRKQRRMMLPAFHHKRIKQYADHMRDHAVTRIDSWPEDRPIALKSEFISLATTVATRALFGTELAADAVTVVERALPVLTRGVSVRVLDPTGLVEKLPTAANRLFERTMAELDELISTVVQRYRTSGGGDDLLSVFIAARDDETNTAMTDTQIRDEIISILLSSAETTALTLTWTSYLVGREPEVQRRLWEEVNTVLAGRAPGYEDLAQLVYMRRVFRETLRLYPPTYFLSRTAVTDTELGGYRIPAGSTVLYSFYAQHRDPTLFREPNTFDPDRWLPERADDVTPAAYLPFGEGAHRCVGEGFAMAEAMTVFATLLSKRELHPEPDAPPVCEVGTVTLAPSHVAMIAPRRAG